MPVVGELIQFQFGCFAVGGVHNQVQVPWWVFVGQQVGLGALIGGVIGYAGGWLLRLAQDRSLTSDRFGGIAVLALAGIAYLAAQGATAMDSWQRSLRV